MAATAAITINTNLASLTCQKYLKSATKGMNTAMEQLSTGFRINSAKDDAAGYAVSAGMEAKINGYDIIEMNSQMGLDMLTTQEGVLDIIFGLIAVVAEDVVVPVTQVKAELGTCCHVCAESFEYADVQTGIDGDEDTMLLDSLLEFVIFCLGIALVVKRSNVCTNA